MKFSKILLISLVGFLAVGGVQLNAGWNPGEREACQASLDRLLPVVMIFDHNGPNGSARSKQFVVMQALDAFVAKPGEPNFVDAFFVIDEFKKNRLAIDLMREVAHKACGNPEHVKLYDACIHFFLLMEAPESKKCDCFGCKIGLTEKQTNLVSKILNLHRQSKQALHCFCGSKPCFMSLVGSAQYFLQYTVLPKLEEHGLNDLRGELAGALANFGIWSKEGCESELCFVCQEKFGDLLRDGFLPPQGYFRELCEELEGQAAFGPVDGPLPLHLAVHHAQQPGGALSPENIVD